MTVLTQAGAESIDGNGNVLILVCVDSHHYPGGIEMRDGGHSRLLVLGVGWHPPAGRADKTAMGPKARLL